MAGSIDKVLQADGTYKWEVTELKPKTQEVSEVSVLIPLKPLQA